jgi:hypothetical protein
MPAKVKKTEDSWQIREQKAKDRGQKTERREQKAENREQRAESRKAEWREHVTRLAFPEHAAARQKVASLVRNDEKQRCEKNNKPTSSYVCAVCFLE